MRAFPVVIASKVHVLKKRAAGLLRAADKQRSLFPVKTT
jgi:hypothetical protein